MRTFPVYAVVSLTSFLLFFVFGVHEGSVYVDSMLVQLEYIPLAVIVGGTVLSILLFSHKRVETYLIGFLIIIYGFFTAGAFGHLSLMPYPFIALTSELALFSKVVGFNRTSSAKLGAFATVILAMFILGSSLRFTGGPPQYAVAFGSIYDNIRPGGVPLLYTGGVVIYTRYLVLSLSIPVIALFTSLSIVLTENYYLIVKLLKGQGLGGIRKSMSGALTVLSCQCEGITAYFPAAIATILFTAIIPLITESIVFILLTDLLLTFFYLKKKRVTLLDRIWGMTSTRPFMSMMMVALIAIPLYTVLAVYLGLQYNLLVFSSINVLMFVYGIFIAFLASQVVRLKERMSSFATYLIVALSSVGMFVWYFPSVTAPTVSSPAVFSLMSTVTVAAGLLSGILFRMKGEAVKKLYLEFITMMFSMLAIIVFYITAISTRVIWPEFGIREQLIFSLLLWGLTLPVMWLSTNISLNSGGGMTSQGKVEDLQGAQLVKQ